MEFDSVMFLFLQETAAATSGCSLLELSNACAQNCSEVARLSTPLRSFWLEQELDSLWVGVRKFGQGNWEKILKDSSLCFSELKTAEDLAQKWKKERLKSLAQQQHHITLFLLN